MCLRAGPAARSAAGAAPPAAAAASSPGSRSAAEASPPSAAATAKRARQPSTTHWQSQRIMVGSATVWATRWTALSSALGTTWQCPFSGQAAFPAWPGPYQRP